MKKLFIFCIHFIFLAFANAEDHGYYPSTYLEERFTQLIDKDKVNTIVELGTFSGSDAILLHLHYKCPVYTFDCDPNRWDMIRDNLSSFPNISFLPYGVWNETKTMTFYCADLIGTSSFYQFDVENFARWEKISVEELVEKGVRMKPIQVQAIRLDEWMESAGIKQIDLLCIDIQGGTLSALQGLGSHLKDITYIITEVEYSSIYQQEPMFPEINQYLSDLGFKCFYANPPGPWGDVMFINQNLIQ